LCPGASNTPPVARLAGEYDSDVDIVACTEMILVVLFMRLFIELPPIFGIWITLNRLQRAAELLQNCCMT
jgi:hypothetical protein